MDIGIVKLFLQKKICFSLKQNLQKLQQTAFWLGRAFRLGKVKLGQVKLGQDKLG